MVRFTVFISGMGDRGEGEKKGDIRLRVEVHLRVHAEHKGGKFVKATLGASGCDLSKRSIAEAIARDDGDAGQFFVVDGRGLLLYQYWYWYCWPRISSYERMRIPSVQVRRRIRQLHASIKLIGHNIYVLGRRSRAYMYATRRYSVRG